MRTSYRRILLMLLTLFIPLWGLSAPPKDKDDDDEDKQEEKKKDKKKDKAKQLPPKELIRIAVQALIKNQEEGGRWSYQALHEDGEEEDGLPLGFRVGGTSITATAVMFAAPNDKDAQAAVQRAMGWLLKELDHPKMVPLKENAYDVRIWGHSFALEFLCHARARKATGKYAKEVDSAIKRLVETIIEEEFEGGGWNYAGRPQASFVTAPVVQALLLARSQGEKKVTNKLLARCRKILEADRMQDGAFTYGGKGDPEVSKEKGIDALAGSAGRSPLCEATLMLLGGSSVDAVRAALNNLEEHRADLEERRAQSGTHEGEYGIAPYFYLYGHRFAAQAVLQLPKEERAKAWELLIKPIIEVRDEDGTWCDRDGNLAPRAHFVGTAFAIFVLLGEETSPLPPKWTKKKKKTDD